MSCIKENAEEDVLSTTRWSNCSGVCGLRGARLRARVTCSPATREKTTSPTLPRPKPRKRLPLAIDYSGFELDFADFFADDLRADDEAEEEEDTTSDGAGAAADDADEDEADAEADGADDADVRG